ncbi:transcriptional repressor [Streptomyces sp. Tu 2975]|uniref:Fur family transcriptional regulator n=1 Tax=Streptomyces sp. Tu 2975 TaxID=2676871 RepID=UPI001FC8F0B5|nr:transcriptional repressor [Streptomyces sp. Tu 2975]
MTRQRAAVAQALAGCADFVSAQQLHARMADEGIRVGLTTVYRALQDAERTGGADVVRSEIGERRYRHRPAAEHRHYIICRSCRRGEPLDTDVVERWVAHVSRTTGFAEVDHTLELSGVCGNCRRNRSRAGDAAR